ncbi:hypothetical protein ACJZ2D_003653 [Fusarium nematophilum]
MAIPTEIPVNFRLSSPHSSGDEEAGQCAPIPSIEAYQAHVGFFDAQFASGRDSHPKWADRDFMSFGAPAGADSKALWNKARAYRNSWALNWGPQLVVQRLLVDFWVSLVARSFRTMAGNCAFAQ